MNKKPLERKPLERKPRTKKEQIINQETEPINQLLEPEPEPEPEPAPEPEPVNDITDTEIQPVKTK